MSNMPSAGPPGEALSPAGREDDSVETQGQAPLCSVIIPVFNNCFYTRLCLEALRQSRPGEPAYELIVVDNGSTDDTPEILSQFKDDIDRVVTNPENRGFASASNQGAALARGNYLVFLNNDVIVQPGWLRSLVSVARAEANIGAVGARLLYPDGTIQHAGIVFAPGPSPQHAFVGYPRDWPEALVRRDYQAVTGACLLAKRELFEDVGGFDGGYQNSYEDIDLCFKLRQAGLRVVYCPDALAYHFESATAGRFLRDDHSSSRFTERWADKVVIDFDPSTRSFPVVRGAGSLMHLEREALAHRVRTLTAQNSQLLSLLSGSSSPTEKEPDSEGTLATLSRPFDLQYRPDYPSPAFAGATVQVPVVITNFSAEAFPRGFLSLSYHWRRVGEPDYVVWDGQRTAIGDRLAPGRPISLSATLLLPDSPGYYLLEWDAVQEGVAWMSQRGVPPYRQFVPVRSSQSIVASIEGLPTIVTCSSVVEVIVHPKGGASAWHGEKPALGSEETSGGLRKILRLKGWRVEEPSPGWRWVALDGQEESGWVPGDSSLQVEGEEVTLRLKVRMPWRSGSYWLEIGQQCQDGTWMPLETIGGSTYVLAGDGPDLQQEKRATSGAPSQEQTSAEADPTRLMANWQWLAGEAEYCLSRIQQLLFPTGSRLQVAKLQSMYLNSAEKEHWQEGGRLDKFEWAVRRWLAEVAGIEQQLHQERERSTKLAGLIDSYRKNQLSDGPSALSAHLSAGSSAEPRDNGSEAATHARPSATPSAGVATTRVLVISHEPVGTMMAGPAIRCWELANALGGLFDVTLAVPEVPDLSAASFRLATYQYDSPGSLEDMARNADAILLSGYLLASFPALAQSGRPLIVDIYDPFPIENLGLHRERSTEERIAISRSDFRVLGQLLRAGDFFLCGSERQRSFWLGMLAASGRLNPLTYAAGPSFRKLIDVVSMGIPKEPPTATTPLKQAFPEIETGDFLLIWPGGLWEWLDPLTAVEAVHLVAEEAPDVKLLFPGIRHPHPERVGAMETPDAVIKRANDLGLIGRQVFYNDWTPYAERADYLVAADVALSLHFDTLESRLAIRARLLDCIWAGTPVISTRGDVIAEAMAERGLAKTVRPRDPSAVAEAILSWRRARRDRDKLSDQFRKMSDAYRWSTVSRPLVDYLAEPRRAADHFLAGGGTDLPATDVEQALAEALQKLREQDTEVAAARDLLRRIGQGKAMRFMNAFHSVTRRLRR